MTSEGPWLAARPPTERPGPRDLPASADVVIVGGGLAGVACALFLAEGGARPVLLEARDDVGRGGSGRHPGILFGGTGEPPFRLLDALGEVRGREVYDFGRQSVDLLAERTPVARTGGLWVALDDREGAQMDANAAALERMGVTAVVLPEGAVEEMIGEAFGPALLVTEDALVDPAAAVADLAGAAEGLGARIFVRSRVTGVERVDAGVRVSVDGGSIVADVVVLAAEAASVDVHEFFHDKITPVREQALITAPTTLPLCVGIRGQQGWFGARTDVGGRLVVRGARWSTPHFEVGETEAVPGGPVAERLEGLLRARFPSLSGVPIVDRWAWIDAASCDGLPIVGPMPGSPRFLCLAGFNGNEAGLGVRAARVVADGLLTGRAPGLPQGFGPERFVG